MPNIILKYINSFKNFIHFMQEYNAKKFLYLNVLFSHLSIVSVDGQQHLSEVVFSALVGFSM